MERQIHVSSEVGCLKAVLLHRPGRELESLTPQYLDSMLFEDIPYLPRCRKSTISSHSAADYGCQVHYVESLLEEVFATSQLRDNAIQHLVGTSTLYSPSLKEIITEHLSATTQRNWFEYCIEVYVNPKWTTKLSKRRSHIS